MNKNVLRRQKELIAAVAAGRKLKQNTWQILGKRYHEPRSGQYSEM